MGTWVKKIAKTIPTDVGDQWLLGLAAGSLLFGVALLALGGSVANLRHETRIGVIAGDGEARRREANGFQWRLIGADTPIYLHDTVRTTSLAGVVIQLENGRYLDIGPGTVLRLESVQEAQTEVSLLAGRLLPTEQLVVHDVVGRREMAALLAVPRLPVPHMSLPR